MILDKFKAFGDTFIAIHEHVGFKMVVKYSVLILLVIAAFNIRAVTAGIIEFVSDIQEEIHYNKMSLQEEYYTDLSPILSELRAEAGADRVLYFEYHNSLESLDGMPFKFFNLMKCSAKYGIPEVPGSTYKDISASMYTELFSEIADGGLVTCQGFYDTDFRKTYRGVYELLSESDHSKQFAIFSLPGIRKPIGFIVLEWMDDDSELNINQKIVCDYRPRINAISAYARKR